MQFVSAVFSAIPDEYRPIASRGTPGLTRKPFQKKHKQLQERERNLERFSAWLSKQSVEQRRRRNPDQLCFELRSN
jgi:hypothetical protein